MPHLHIQSGPRAGDQIEVTQEMVIGRVDADLTIDDAELSRRHLVVRPVLGGLEVEDLKSANGTFIEGVRIEGTTRVSSGDILKLGTTVIEVQEVADSRETRVSLPTLDRGATRLHNVPAGVAPGSSEAPADDHAAAGGSAPPSSRATSPAATAAPAPFAPPGGRGAPAASAAALGAFVAPSSRRGGLATRSWVPVALSFGSMILTAVALVVYFAAR